VFMCFVILYPVLSFQLTIGRIGLLCLCNFIVSCICGAFRFMLMHFHLLHLFRLLCMFRCSLFVMSCGNFVIVFSNELLFCCCSRLCVVWLTCCLCQLLLWLVGFDLFCSKAFNCVLYCNYCTNSQEGLENWL
jgi:hypothetical protein